MSDDINKIVIVNLSNDDDTNIPTPTITTSRIDEDPFEKAMRKNSEEISNVDNNINNILNEISTETESSNEHSTEKALLNEASKESLINNKQDESQEVTDSSLSDIDLNQMISEQLNTDFTEVDLNSSRDTNHNIDLDSNPDNYSVSYFEEPESVPLEQLIDNVDLDHPIKIGSTTADIINSSLMKLNLNEEINNSLDSISSESISSTESDTSNDSIKIKIILSNPEDEQVEVYNSNSIKIIVTDPDNIKQTIYPYHENGLKEAVNKAIDKHKNKTKSKTKSKTKKSKKAKKTVRFNIENDTYCSDNEVIPMVDENSMESLRKEIDRLNSRIVEEIKARTILQHTLDDTIIETEKVKKEAVEKSDLKIRETMEYVHRLQESMDNRINKMQNENLEKYKELQAAHDARLEEEREVWRQIDQDARKRLQDERDEKNHFIEENKRLEKVVEKLKRQIEEEATNSENFQLSVKQMLEEYENKYKEEQLSRKNAEEVIDRVLEKSRDFQENVEDLNFLNKSLKDNNRELSEKLSEAESKIEYKEKFIEELKSKIGDLNFTIEILKEESENSIQKIKILSSETQNITDRSIQQINEVREENVNIYKLLDSTTKKYDELQTLYNIKVEEVELLKKKMEQMNKKFKRILRKNIMKSGLDSATSPVSAINFSNTSFEIMSNNPNNSSIKETPILGEPSNVIDDTDDNSSVHKQTIRKKASNASISSTTLSISSLLMTSQNDMNMTPILPYGMNEVIKEEDEIEDEVISLEEKQVPLDRRDSKDSNNSNNSGNKINEKKLPKLTIQTNNDEIIENILSAQVSDSDDDDTDDADYKTMNDGELSTMIEKRTMEFRTDDTEYLDFVEKLKIPSKIATAKFIKRCEVEEITGCLTFEGEYSGFFNNRKLWNNAKAGTILIEPITKHTAASESSDDTAVVESQQQYVNLKCALCSLRKTNYHDMASWFKFKAAETDPNYEKICPYCREKLANACEWYTYIRLIQNNMIKKNPKLIYSDLLDIKRKLFYSKNGISFKYQN
ncbi:hypothetical protein BCR36DRAFT_580789 [Piromyces finnis]|uniref:GDP/GTP exchange factor Sec2 N-terminal domain-containing protein n=1 Tax=Piromyces finnis TaxID=1754191 RepID=A0A1Y1VI72_9FUNG|nr:hypothetical protein BCR36DRAFT_580789 [Piromyces finnis]|eukprot:ORX56485.1 hypothetical protein BCR36DRAFT_580789 [Piromyces finnis]